MLEYLSFRIPEPRKTANTDNDSNNNESENETTTKRHEAPRRKLKANGAETGVLNLLLLQYYCEHCWATIHSRPGREFHKPLVKEGADRPRAVPYRWC